jgi:hypothetical protein
MKSEKITEKIEFLVDKWIDEAHMADIIDYARERLTNYYLNLGDDIVEGLYEAHLKEEEE